MSGQRAFVDRYLEEVVEIAGKVDRVAIAGLLERARSLRENGGRLFVLGVGGSAANASHAVNDFRKIVGIEAYAPSDNVAELTAWANDESWDAIFIRWLSRSRLSSRDAVLVLSVGGGSNATSPNLVRAIDHAVEVGASVWSIVSRDGGHAAAHSDVCVLIPMVETSRITPHAEEWQGVIWHLVVSALSAR